MDKSIESTEFSKFSTSSLNWWPSVVKDFWETFDDEIPLSKKKLTSGITSAIGNFANNSRLASNVLFANSSVYSSFTSHERPVALSVFVPVFCLHNTASSEG
jgi:hypothetical protein